MSFRVCLVSWERASLEKTTHHSREMPFGFLVLSFEQFEILQLKYETTGPNRNL